MQAATGAGPAGSSCEPYRPHQGLTHIALEGQAVPGSRAIQTSSGSVWHETGLPVRLHAHFIVLRLFEELAISGRLHRVTPCSGQKKPAADFLSAGNFIKQPTLASMEGAVFSGKLCARAIAETYLAPSTAVHA